MNNKLSIFFLLFLMHFLLPDPVAAYNDTITHRELTLHVVEKSPLKGYLADELLIADDLSKPLKGHSKEQTILKWLQDGSQMEDDPPCRASNHFHDPTTFWEFAGLSDTVWYINAYCNTGDYPSGEISSNLTWATGFYAADQDLPTATGNNWDWNVARKFYYAALSGDSTELDGLEIEEGKWFWQETTITGETSLNETERNKYLAWTFRALGNVLHLLQDGSVPAHVRNDFKSHRNFNGIDNLKPKEWIGNPYEHYVKHNNDIIQAIVPDEPHFQNPRLTDYWDSDGQQNEGITEYVNQTFFSASTIPNNNPDPEHVFPEPSVSSATHYICEETLQNKPHKRHYISREPCPDPGTDPVDHFAAVSKLNEGEITPANISTLLLELDHNVLDDYAREILPYTLGYSIELLDYFFRGKIDMQPNPNGTGYIVLNKGDEALTEGTLELFYDADDGNRYPVNVAEWNVPGDTGIIWAGAISLPIGFVPPTDALNPDKYMLVYRGKMGQEEDAVVGKPVDLAYKLYLVMSLSTSTSIKYTIWDVINNEPAKIKQTGSDEYVLWPINYGSEITAFLSPLQSIQTEDLFNTVTINYTYNDWIEESYALNPNGFPTPCDVCNAGYTEEKTLKRTQVENPFVEQTEITAKELSTDSWECVYHQGYEQNVCGDLYSPNPSGWETTVTNKYLPYEPLYYSSVSKGIEVTNPVFSPFDLFAQNMDADGQIYYNLEAHYSSRIDGYGQKMDHPFLGGEVQIMGERVEENSNTWEIITPWLTHSISQYSYTLSNSGGAYCGFYNRIGRLGPNTNARVIVKGSFNDFLIFRVYHQFHEIQAAGGYNNINICTEPPPELHELNVERLFCTADSAILVTDDTGMDNPLLITDDTSTVNPFTDMPNNLELSDAICELWEISSEIGSEPGLINFSFYEN